MYTFALYEVGTENMLCLIFTHRHYHEQAEAMHPQSKPLEFLLQDILLTNSDVFNMPTPVSNGLNRQSHSKVGGGGLTWEVNLVLLSSVYKF